MAKSCLRCRGPRACRYCGGKLGERQSKSCGAPSCAEAYRLEKQARAAARIRERYAIEPEYREWRLGINATWRANNPTTVAEGQLKYYLANREKRIADAAKRAVSRRAHKRNTMVLPFTAEQLRDRLLVYDRCWICGSEAWEEVDHVKPIAKGGPHILANLRPACRNCNRRKSATWPMDTSIRRG